MKSKSKKYYCKCFLQCFSSKNIFTEHKNICLNINGALSVRLEKETIDFKDYSNKYQFQLKFRLILSEI